MTDSATRLLTEAVLVTGNRGKLVEARRLGGVEMPSAVVDLPELQSLDIQEVLRAKAREAFRLIGQPLIVDETGLELAALNGFPGVLVKWMLESVGAEGIARTAHRLGDTKAIARCALLYFDGTREILATGTTTGQLIDPPRGDAGFGWDPIFQPEGVEETFAELSGPDKDRLSHRGQAWRNLIELLDREP